MWCASDRGAVCRRIALTCGLAGIVALVLSASALGAGSVVTVGSPLSNDPLFDTNYTNGPLACPNSFGTAYAYGSGNQSATNSYNISPGQPNSAWKVAIARADCNVEDPGVGGGPSGFGVLETNDSNSTTVYHRFDPATMKFDTPLVPVAKQSELDAAVSQDGAGGIYGTYLLDGAGVRSLSPVAATAASRSRPGS
jgi:hypothetical protein